MRSRSRRQSLPSGGQATTFRLTCIERLLRIKVNALQLANIEMAKKRILIVDDDLDTRRVLNVLFRANNYETAFAADAVTAFIAAKKEKPDLILLDIGLPGGEGFLVMERLKNIARLGCIPIIMLSGRDPQSVEERALQAGADAFLQKPPDQEKLLAAVRKALGERGGGTQERA